MSDPIFSLKVDDLWPRIAVTLEDSNGDPVDLSGVSSVTFSMSEVEAGTAKVVAQTALIVSATEGKVAYQWQAGDTDTEGLYKAEFNVVFTGAPGTVPNGNYLLVRIIPHV